jgi:hypothetical protein
MTLTTRIVKNELAFERAVFQHRRLAMFRRNATTWESLLLLAACDGDEGPGLYEVVESVQTTALGQSALLRFLRDCRDEGTVVFTRSAHKQSKWTLSISPELRSDLMALLHMRAGPPAD